MHMHLNMNISWDAHEHFGNGMLFTIDPWKGEFRKGKSDVHFAQYVYIQVICLRVPTKVLSWP